MSTFNPTAYERAYDEVARRIAKRNFSSRRAEESMDAAEESRGLSKRGKARVCGREAALMLYLPAQPHEARHLPRRGGREAEGGGLLNRCTRQNVYRGFESPPLRQYHPALTSRSVVTQRTGNAGVSTGELSKARQSRSVAGRTSTPQSALARADRFALSLSSAP